MKQLDILMAENKGCRTDMRIERSACRGRAAAVKGESLKMGLTVKNTIKSFTPKSHTPRGGLCRSTYPVRRAWLLVCFCLGCLVLSSMAFPVQPAANRGNRQAAHSAFFSRLAVAVEKLNTFGLEVPAAATSDITRWFLSVPAETEASGTEPVTPMAKKTSCLVVSRFPSQQGPSVFTRRKSKSLYLYHKSLLC